MNIPGFRLHPLKGADRGRWSIWANGNWRLTFEFREGRVHDLDYEDNVRAGTANITYVGSIGAGSGVRSVSIASKTGGAVTLSGAVAARARGSRSPATPAPRSTSAAASA